MNPAALPPLLLLLLILASDLWVWVDAKAHADRGTPVEFSAQFIRLDTPGLWVLSCLFVWVVGFPLYLVTRSRADDN